MRRHPPRSCPCVLVSCRLSFPSLQCRSLFLIDVCTSRRGTDTLLWCPSQCNVAVTEVHTPPTHTHPPPPAFHKCSQHFKHQGPAPFPSSSSKSLISTNSGFVASWSISVPGVYVYLSSCIHMRIGRLVLSSPHHHHHCFAHPSSPLSLIPVFPEICVFWKCVWKCPQDGECGSRVGKKHSTSTPPHARTIPFPSPTTRVLFLSDSVEGRRNFAHMTILWRMKHRPGGRNMIPTCAWPILILRGVSQPTPNAPEVPRTVGVCLDISNTYVPRYFHIFISSALRMFVKNAI